MWRLTAPCAHTGWNFSQESGEVLPPQGAWRTDLADHEMQEDYSRVRLQPTFVAAPRTVPLRPADVVSKEAFVAEYGLETAHEDEHVHNHM